MHKQNELFQSVNPQQKKPSNRAAHVLIGILCTILVIASYIFFSTKPVSIAPATIALTIPDLSQKMAPSLPELSVTSTETVDPEQISSAPENLPTQSMQSFTTTWQEYKIQAGESLSAIFSSNDLSKLDLHNIIHSNDISAKFAAILPGKSLMIGRDIAGNLSHLIYKKSAYEELKATRLDDGDFIVEQNIKELNPRIKTATGVIHTSLFIDGKNAGLSDNIIMQLANIFAWDIDFALSLHEGDKFSVIYENLYIDDEFIRPGNILAAEFMHHGKSIKTIRYQNADGKSNYYNSAGNSMRKAFLRSPIDFARISSHFNLKRKHPKLNRIRAHKGVDYAARSGTPIKSAGDGKITFRGRKGGYGRVVIIQHGQKYSTLYAHMSKFRKGQKVGSRVQQGQVIGYVGRSGLATGPHLHYEFHINGVHRNPLTVTLPNANPIQEKYKTDFWEKAKPLLKQLEQLNTTQIVDINTAP